jgi:hypothetical protein
MELAARLQNWRTKEMHVASWQTEVGQETREGQNLGTRRCLRCQPLFTNYVVLILTRTVRYDGAFGNICDCLT